MKRAASPSFRASTMRDALDRALDRQPLEAGGASRTAVLFPLLRRIAIAVLPVVVILVWMWTLGAQRRAIEAMPPADRAALYEESLEAFKTACTPPRAGLFDHCRAQADFLTNFDRCADECRSLVAPLLRWRSR